MARRIFRKLELLLLSAFELFVLAFSVSGSPPVAAQSDSAASVPLPLGSFLKGYPGSKDPKTIGSSPSITSFLTLGDRAFADHKFLKLDKYVLLEARTFETFKAECSSLNGFLYRPSRNIQIMYDFEQAKRMTLARYKSAWICLDNRGDTMGGLVMLQQFDREFTYAGVFVLTAAAAEEMLAIHERQQASRGQ
jgi:hypothetical protein